MGKGVTLTKMLKSTPPLREETNSGSDLYRQYQLKSTPPLREETDIPVYPVESGYA